MAFLDDGYGKFAVLRADRTVEFHAPYGKHHEVSERVKKHRAMPVPLPLPVPVPVPC